MKNLMRLFNRNLLLKVAGFNSIHILIRIATGAVMSWILARMIGPAGMAVLGNFRNFFQGVQSFSVLGLENGLVRYAAEHKQAPNKLARIYSTAARLCLAVSILLGVLIFFMASQLDSYLIGEKISYAYVFQFLAVAMPFYIGFIWISSLLQGFEWFRRFIVFNIIVNLLVFAASAVLVLELQLDGALLAIVATPVIQCAVGFILWQRYTTPISLKAALFEKLDSAQIKPLFSYSGMALLSALLIPITFIAVRQDVRAVVGDTTAGNWEGLQRISGYYMMFATSLVSLYVLPKLSKNSSHATYRETIAHFYKTILPPLALGLIAIYVSRELIVEYLFTDDFAGMLPMFQWQLAGDFIKVVTTVLAFRFIAINDFKRYAIAEVISLASFFTANYILTRTYGDTGVVMAHLTSYLIYALTIVLLLRKELFQKG